MRTSSDVQSGGHASRVRIPQDEGRSRRTSIFVDRAAGNETSAISQSGSLQTARDCTCNDAAGTVDLYLGVINVDFEAELDLEQVTDDASSGRSTPCTSPRLP